MPSFLLKISFLFILLFVLRCSNATSLAKVILPQAVDKGAVCLDGSPPAYYIHYGTITPNKWIIHHEGGGWCYNVDACGLRASTPQGSSKLWPPTRSVSGIMSDDCTTNPHFCGWTIVEIAYCDGASFSGNLDTPIVTWTGTTLYFRGFRILEAVMDALLTIGVEDAEEVILTGCSAGGFATYLHADYLRSRIPANIPVYAMADAGYFIDAPNVRGEYQFRGLMQDVFVMQNCTGGVNQDCIAAYAGTGEEWKCFMAQYTYPHIKTPIFLINSRYDLWQVLNILEPYLTIGQNTEEVLEFGDEFLIAAAPAIQSPTNGVFIDSCSGHCQTTLDGTWTSIIVGNQTMGDSFYGWMTKNPKVSIKEIDCDGPTCNPTC